MKPASVAIDASEIVNGGSTGAISSLPNHQKM